MDILLMRKTGCKTHPSSASKDAGWFNVQSTMKLQTFKIVEVWSSMQGPGIVCSQTCLTAPWNASWSQLHLITALCDLPICTWPPWYWQSDSEQISSLSKSTSQVPSWSASSSPSTLPVLWTSLDVLQRLVFDCLDQGTRKKIVLLKVRLCVILPIRNILLIGELWTWKFQKMMLCTQVEDFTFMWNTFCQTQCQTLLSWKEMKFCSSLLWQWPFITFYHMIQLPRLRFSVLFLPLPTIACKPH